MAAHSDYCIVLKLGKDADEDEDILPYIRSFMADYGAVEGVVFQEGRRAIYVEFTTTWGADSALTYRFEIFTKFQHLPIVAVEMAHRKWRTFVEFQQQPRRPFFFDEFARFFL